MVAALGEVDGAMVQCLMSSMHLLPRISMRELQIRRVGRFDPRRVSRSDPSQNSIHLDPPPSEIVGSNGVAPFLPVGSGHNHLFTLFHM
jgi:hypothetical protein